MSDLLCICPSLVSNSLRALGIWNAWFAGFLIVAFRVYYLAMEGVGVGVGDLAKEILSEIWKKERIPIEEIQGRFNLTKETTKAIIEFLVKFGFVQLDKNNGHISLSETLRNFYDEMPE